MYSKSYDRERVAIRPDITSSAGSLDFGKSRHHCDVWRIRFVLVCGRRIRDVATQATQAWLHGVCKAAIYVCGVLVIVGKKHG